ncbi:MAG: dual specificity protein phosphatase family protein [bacterium]
MRITLFCLALLLTAPLLPARGDEASTGRTWATHIDEPGLPNFARVNDHLFRGAQPTAEGFRQLEKLGFRTVVSFRRFHDDKNLLAGTGLAYLRIPMTAALPDVDDIVEFLKIATDTHRWPIFMHCQHGADRTGLQAAAYRMVVEGWSADEAIDEMTRGGFGFHMIYQNLVSLVRSLDAADLRRRAGLAAAPPPAGQRSAYTTP